MNSEQLDWPNERRFYLTLDLECDFGTALPANRYKAVQSVDRLATFLDRFDIPLTCFVQTEVLEIAPEQVELLRAHTDAIFHPHSHTHKPRSEIDVEAEIALSTDRYREFFGTQPAGYRVPNGNIHPKDYNALESHGYEFDASLIPSWRPNYFDNRTAPAQPQYFPESDLYEIPFTVYSDTMWVPTVLSYCQVLGSPFTWLLTRRPRGVVVFNIHMHDLVTPESYQDLPPQYKAIYGRNRHGFDLLERILKRFNSQGYTFGTIDELHDELRGSDEAPVICGREAYYCQLR